MAAVDVLFNFYTGCALRYGIDCFGDDFSSVCATKESLWDSCTQPFANASTNSSSLSTPFLSSSTTTTFSSSSLPPSSTSSSSFIYSSTLPPTTTTTASPSMSVNNSRSFSSGNPCEAAPCISRHLNDLARFDNQRLFTFYAPIASIMCVIAVVTNAIGLAGLTRTRPKYPRHFLLISMSLSDTLLSILTLLKKAGDVSPSPKIQIFFIKYINTVWQTTFLASGIMLLALAVEAFVALTATFLYESFARRRIVVLLFVALVWVISFLFTLTLLLTGRSYDMTFQYAVAGLLMLIIGVTISCYLYAFVLAERARRDIRMQRRASAMIDRAGDYSRSKLGRRKSLLTVCLLMTSSIVSWLPLNVYMMLDKDQVEANFPFYNRLIHAFLIMFHLNAIINPLTYALRMNAVRATLRHFLRMKSGNSSTLSPPSSATGVGSYGFNRRFGGGTGPNDHKLNGNDPVSPTTRSSYGGYGWSGPSVRFGSETPPSSNNFALTSNITKGIIKDEETSSGQSKRKVTIDLSALKSSEDRQKLCKSPSRIRSDSEPTSASTPVAETNNNNCNSNSNSNNKVNECNGYNKTPNNSPISASFSEPKSADNEKLLSPLLVNSDDNVTATAESLSSVKPVAVVAPT